MPHKICVPHRNGLPTKTKIEPSGSQVRSVMVFEHFLGVLNRKGAGTKSNQYNAHITPLINVLSHIVTLSLKSSQLEVK